MGNRKGMVLLLVGLSALVASGLGFGSVLAAHKGFGTIATEFITKYNGGTKQDLSGAATNGEVIIFVDDSLNIVRVVTGGLPDTEAVDRPFLPVPPSPDPLLHKDLEGATRWRGYFVVTTSLEAGLNGATPGPDLRRLTRFKLNDANQLTDQKSVDLRGNKEGTLPNTLTKALRDEFDDAWFDRIKIRAGKDGGLNVEGLSNTRHPGRDALLWGLRSPLFGTDFANCPSPPCEVSAPVYRRSLRTGVAIIAEVERPFSANPSFKFKTLELDTGPIVPSSGSPVSGGRHGIRGMERIPAMQGFVIIGGPAEKGNDYSLWFWDGDNQPDRLDVPGASITSPFRKLCRPESVIQMEKDGEPFLVIFSEHSGDECNLASANPGVAPAEFTFIKARIVPADN